MNPSTVCAAAALSALVAIACGGPPVPAPEPAGPAACRLDDDVARPTTVAQAAGRDADFAVRVPVVHHARAAAERAAAQRRFAAAGELSAAACTRDPNG
jgi:hypothetical protein